MISQLLSNFQDVMDKMHKAKPDVIMYRTVLVSHPPPASIFYKSVKLAL